MPTAPPTSRRWPTMPSWRWRSCRAASRRTAADARRALSHWPADVGQAAPLPARVSRRNTCPRRLRPWPDSCLKLPAGESATMTNFIVYLIGTLLVVAGLAYAASRMGVSSVWILAGALVIIGIGLMGGIVKTRQKDPAV